MPKKQVKDDDDSQQKERVEEALIQYVPFYESFDLDRSGSFLLLAIWRFICTTQLTKYLIHPDELYQGTQIAYDFVFGGVELPWEWKDPYRLRNALYPIYLSWPLWILKYTRMDYQPFVLASPYIAHYPLMLLSDYFFWHVGKQTVGKEATRIAFIFTLTNFFMFEYEIRCFTNTLEKICTVIAFWFYEKQKDRFTANTVIFTALLTIGFMMRNTSPVGWLPLLFLKISRSGAFIPFLLSGIFVAVPLIILCIYLDSIYYQNAHTGCTKDVESAGLKEFEWTVTSWNFIKVNVLEGMSKYFGDHGHFEYILNFLPADVLRGLYPFALGGAFNYAIASEKVGRSADMFYMSAFYILFFSFIGHKEPRFLLPILPFIFLMTGHLFKGLLSSPSMSPLLKGALRLFLIINTIVELAFLCVRMNF